jgi:hypothetical protein
VYVAAAGVLCLFAWGAWRAVSGEPSRPEGEK